MITFLLRNVKFKRAKMGGLGVMGISIEGENWNIVSRFKHNEIKVVTKKSIRKLTFYKYSVIICLSADYIMMVKNLSNDQFFWINSHVNSLLELTFTLTRLFWHLLTLTCSICAMLAEWSEPLWTSQTLLPLHAVAWFLSIVWPPSESQLVAFCSWWRK